MLIAGGAASEEIRSKEGDADEKHFNCGSRVLKPPRNSANSSVLVEQWWLEIIHVAEGLKVLHIFCSTRSRTAMQQTRSLWNIFGTTITFGTTARCCTKRQLQLMETVAPWDNDAMNEGPENTGKNFWQLPNFQGKVLVF